MNSKINILPVDEDSEEDYLSARVLETLGPLVKHLNGYGARYDHSVPWIYKYFKDPKFYLYRVTIGSIGRINTVEDAVELAISTNGTAFSVHFTSMALYYIYRMARQVKKEYKFRKQIQDWVNILGEKKMAYSRFIGNRG